MTRNASTVRTLLILLAMAVAGCTGFDPSGVNPGGADANVPDAPLPVPPDARTARDAPAPLDASAPDGASADGAPADAASADGAPADAAATADGSVPGCWNDPRYATEDPATGHRYWPYDDVFPLSWGNASTACGMDDAYLAVIDTMAENDLVRGLVAFGDIWIGLSDLAVEGTFEWVNGAPLVFQNWAAGEPNAGTDMHDCVEMYAGGRWNDTTCGGFTLNSFVCECDPDYLP